MTASNVLIFSHTMNVLRLVYVCLNREFCVHTTDYLHNDDEKQSKVCRLIYDFGVCFLMT